MCVGGVVLEGMKEIGRGYSLNFLGWMESQEREDNQNACERFLNNFIQEMALCSPSGFLLN